MRPALLLVDLQRDFLHRPGLEPAATILLGAIADLLTAFRTRALPVLHVHTLIRPDGSDRMPHWAKAGYWACVDGSPGAAAPPAVAPWPIEPVVTKQFFSGFGNPDLDRRLQAIQADPVVVAGIYLHGCVRATVMDAYAHGYRVWVAEDAVGSTEPDHAAISRRYLDGRAARFLDTAAIIAAVDGAAAGAVSG